MHEILKIQKPLVIKKYDINEIYKDKLRLDVFYLYNYYFVDSLSLCICNRVY